MRDYNNDMRTVTRMLVLASVRTAGTEAETIVMATALALAFQGNDTQHMYT